MLYILLFCLFVLNASALNCDKKGVLLYEDMACKPTCSKTCGCPKSYECTGLKPLDYCVVRNKRVLNGSMSDSNQGLPCQFSCNCYDSTEGMAFSCPQVRCFIPPIGPGCYLTKDIDECCGYKEACNSSISCVVDDQTYLEGQAFYPKHECLECVCKKGWKGQFVAPFCRRLKCGEQLSNQQSIQKSCAPVYLKDGSRTEGIKCCPSAWNCPNGNEVIQGISQQGPKCQYGNKQLGIGQYVDVTSDFGPLRCNCEVPPLLACTERGI